MLIRISALVFLLVACGPSKTEVQRSSDQTAWHQGGTLHKATVAEWETATPQNKLATSADWVAKAAQLKGQQLDDETMRKRAAKLWECVNDAVRVLPEGNKQSSVSEYATACLVSSAFFKE